MPTALSTGGLRSVILAVALASAWMLTAPPAVPAASEVEVQGAEADDGVRTLIVDAARGDPLGLWMAADFPWARQAYADAAGSALQALDRHSPFTKFHHGRLMQIGAAEGSQSDAVRLIREAAETGEGNAMAWYGTMLLHDAVTEADRDAARRWLVRAVDQGNWFAGLRLTIAYRDGVLTGHGFEAPYWRGVSEDLRVKGGWGPIRLASPAKPPLPPPGTAGDTIHRLWEAARQGQGTAQYKLAMAYERGDGVATDPTMAAEWYRRSALNGIAQGAYEVARLMRDGAIAGTPEDMRNLIQEAARFHVADAEAWLGFLAMTGGMEIPKDSAEAVYWMRRAALRGSAWGKFLLARALERGDGTDADPKAARRWLEEAAEGGWLPAMRDMAARSVDEDGTILDLPRLEHWMTRAIQAGDPRAQADLGMALVAGASDDATRRRGLDLLEAATRSSDHRAHGFLALHEWEAGNRANAWAHAVMAGDAFPEKAALSRADMERQLTPEEWLAADRLMRDWRQP